jgi:hypothetical protein
MTMTGAQRARALRERRRRGLRKLSVEIHEDDLILSIFFLKVLWISDATSMSAYWVVRPWNKHLLPTK